MKTFKIPNYRTGFGCDRANIDECVRVGVLPKGFGIFGTVQQWFDVSPYQPPMEGFGAKFWRDNSTLWGGLDNYCYLRLARNSDGSYSQNIKNIPATSTALGQSVLNFYNTYQSQFLVRPSFELVNYTKSDAGRLNFSTSEYSDPIPVGIGNSIDGTTSLQLSWPSNMALRFTNGNTEVEAFDIQDYMRENPVPQPVVVSANSTSTLTDNELVNIVKQIINSNLTVNTTALMLRAVLK